MTTVDDTPALTGEQQAVQQGEMSGLAGQNEFISFSIGEDQYGVEIIAVREIKGWTKITHLPNQPDYVRGVLNLRGVMVPIIDLRCRFGEGVTQETPMHVIIVVQIKGKLVGILADRVLDIVSFEADKIQPVPNVGSTNQADFLSGLTTIGESMLALIDLERLLVMANQVADPQKAASLAA